MDLTWILNLINKIKKNLFWLAFIWSSYKLKKIKYGFVLPSYLIVNTGNNSEEDVLIHFAAPTKNIRDFWILTIHVTPQIRAPKRRENQKQHL